jgi:hypothetical protein
VSEPIVTLTNASLALECFVFAELLRRGSEGGQGRRWDFVAFFAALGAAALAGGLVHGFFPEEGTLPHEALWRTALLALGGAALAGWRIGASLTLPERSAGIVAALAGLATLAYAGVVLLVDQDFRIAVFFYAPGVVFLGSCFAVAARRGPDPRLGWAAAGLGLALFASVLQRMEVGLHPVHFDHNALYHVLEMLALVPVFRAARGLQAKALRSKRGSARSAA